MYYHDVHDATLPATRLDTRLVTMRYRLTEWQPEGDNTQPGSVVRSLNAQPTVRGSYRELPRISSSNTTLATFTNAMSAQSLPVFGLNASFTNRHVMLIYEAGVNIPKLYEFNAGGNSYTNISRTAAYNAIGQDFGFQAVSVKPSGNDGIVFTGFFGGVVLQYSSASNVVCIDLDATAPVAKHVVKAGDFVLAFSGNLWYCSAIGNIFSWTPSIATQAATGAIDNEITDISAVQTINNNVVVFTLESIFIGQYVGPPQIWAWQLITRKIGCIGREAALVIDNQIYFLSRNSFYVFDGSYPREVPGYSAIRDYVMWEENLRQTGATIAPPIGANTIFSPRLVYHELDKCIWIFPSSDVSTGNYFYIYDLETGRFSLGDQTNIRAIDNSRFIFQYQSRSNQRLPGIISGITAGGIRINTWSLGMTGGTFGTFPAAEFKFGPYGQEDAITQIARLRLILWRVTGNVRVRMDGSDSLHGTFVNYLDRTVNSATTLLKFDSIVPASAKRYHKITVNFDGEFDFDGFDLAMRPVSKE